MSVAHNGEMEIYVNWESLKKDLLILNGPGVLMPYGNSTFENYISQNKFPAHEAYKHTFKAIKDALKLASEVKITKVSWIVGSSNVIVRYR